MNAFESSDDSSDLYQQLGEILYVDFAALEKRIIAGLLQGGNMLITVDTARETGDQIVVTFISSDEITGKKFTHVIHDDMVFYDDVPPTMSEEIYRAYGRVSKTTAITDQIGQLIAGTKAQEHFILDYAVRLEHDFEPIEGPGFQTGKRQFQQSRREILAAQRRGSKRKGRR